MMPPDDADYHKKPPRHGVDPTCMSYWLPKIEAAGLPSPRTIMVDMPDEAFIDIWNLFDNKPMKGDAEPFFEKMRKAADQIGYPSFLRSGHFSGKHDWERTCYLKNRADVDKQLFNIMYMWECVSFAPVDMTTWAVREFLPTMPVAVCPTYSNMPVCKEFRFFVRDSEVICFHPYWPRESLEQGGVSETEINAIFPALCDGGNNPALHEIASRAGAAVGGAWSIDLLETERGWFLTDMAEAHKSFHWEGCTIFRELVEKAKRGELVE